MPPAAAVFAARGHDSTCPIQGYLNMGMRPRSGAWRPSFVDVATVVVLALAVVVASVPGGALNTEIHGWLTRRRLAATVRREWPVLQRWAAPLYIQAGAPDLVEFADYQCPFCRQDQPTVDSALAHGVRVAVLQRPLSIHPRAIPAALAAICAVAAGEFPAVHHFLMHSDQWIKSSAPTIIPDGASAKAKETYAACDVAASTQHLLNEQLAIADSLGIAATPTFVSPRGIMAVRPTLANLLEFAHGK